MDQSGNISRLYRRTLMMLGLGKTSSYSTDNGVAQTVQYKTPLEVKGNTPRMAEYGFSSSLPVGSDVLIAFLGGDRSNAVIIGSNHQDFRHQGLKPGETVIYNQWGQHIVLTETGIIVEANGQPVTVTNATEVTVNASNSVRLDTPRLLVTGDIIDNCDQQSTTLKQLRDTYNIHDHGVNGVEGGDATVTSSPPQETVS